MHTRVAFGAIFFLAVGVSACVSHGGDVDVTPLNPTFPASASPSATVPGGPSPAVSPSTVASGAVPNGCGNGLPDPNTSTVTFTGASQTIPVPQCGDFVAQSVVPANNGAGATVMLQSSIDNALGSTTNPPPNEANLGTPLVYSSLELSTIIDFGTGAQIPVTVTSPTKITAGHTYAARVCAIIFGGRCTPTQNDQTGLMPTGNTVNFVLIPPGGNFPGQTVAVVTVYQSS